jgi:hypothetical protein
LQYRFSGASSLQITYTTATATPALTQLQGSINNSNQLYLQTGNPDLRQTYRQNVTLRYMSAHNNNRSRISIHAGAATAAHYISNAVTVAANDTMIGTVQLYKGGQLSSPVNLEGYRSFNTGINYALPLRALKSNLAVELNGSMTRIPALINSRINHSLRQSITMGINLNSNISENVDYTLITNTSYGHNANTLNTTYSSNYFSQDAGLSLNITFLKDYIWNTDLYYQYNSGISAATARDYTLCNISIARKLFKNKQGCIRLTCYDILNQNKSIQYLVTDTYIASSRSSAVQRYATLSFTWSFNKFASSRP